MNHKVTRTFWRLFQNLPPQVQAQAKERFTLLKENPRHPSLHFKKVGKFWSVRINDNYRALAVKRGDIFIWVWIGTHDEYSKIVK